MAKYEIGNTAETPDGKKFVYVKGGWLSADTPEGAEKYKIALAEQERGKPIKPPFMASVGRGMTDITQGVRQVAGDVGIPGGMTPEEEAAEKADVALYEKGQGDGFDWGRVGGQALATSPLMAVPGLAATGAVARTTAGAAAGGLAGGSVFANEDGERLNNTLMGVAGGGVASLALPPLLNAAGKGVAAVTRGAGQAWRALTGPNREALTAQLEGAARNAGISLNELSASARAGLQDRAALAMRRGNLDPDALVREARMASFGFVDDAAPLRGQVTRNAREFSEAQNLSKVQGVGDPLANRMDAQRARIGQVLDETGDTIGARADVSIFDAGEAVEGAARGRSEELQNQVGALYRRAQQADPDALLPGSRLQEATADILRERRNAIPADVRRRIAELTADDAQVPPIELENLDKLLSEYFGADRATNSALNLLKDRVRGVMDEASEEFGGAYREAVQAAANRFGAIGPNNQMTGQLVRGALDPEKVAPRLLNGSIRQLRRLRDFVSEANPDAWQAARSSAWNLIMDKAMPSGEFSQAGYNRAIRSVGRERLSILYGEDVARRLLDFGDVARDLLALPAGHSVNTSNTASAGANIIRSALGGIMDHAVPFGRVLTPMLNSGTVQANDAAQRAAVQRMLQGSVGGPGLAQLPPGVESLLSRSGAVAAPIAGLLGASQ